MEKFKSFELKNTMMVLGGEYWDTGCNDGRRTDIYDDVTDSIVYLLENVE